jgi:hypothetical protein
VLKEAGLLQAVVKHMLWYAVLAPPRASLPCPTWHRNMLLTCVGLPSFIRFSANFFSFLPSFCGQERRARPHEDSRLLARQGQDCASAERADDGIVAPGAGFQHKKDSFMIQ